MDQREYLVKAQEAEALANAADNQIQRHTWENIAKEYRRLAKVAAAMHQDDEISSDSLKGQRSA
jgi:hypothetical protein